MELLIYWVVNLVLMSMVMLLILFIGVPLAGLILTGEIHLLPRQDVVYSTIEFILISAFAAGTILWIRGKYFSDHKESNEKPDRLKNQ
jgi:hypothetical protein